MKKRTILVLCIATLLSAAGCNSQGNSRVDYTTASEARTTAVTTEATASGTSSETSGTAADGTGETGTVTTATTAETAEVTTAVMTAVSKRNTDTLVNKMSENERSRAEKRKLTLLESADEAGHKVGIMFQTMDTDYAYELLDDHRLSMSEEDYNTAKAEIDKFVKEGKDISVPYLATVDNCYYTGVIPNLDYNGGTLSIRSSEGATTQELNFANMEEYFDYLKEQGTKNGTNADHTVKAAKLVFDAIINKTYETIPEGSINIREMPSSFFNDPFTDFRDTWEYDRNAVSAIKDSIDEYVIYDDELATEFLVHVTLPPNYDKNKTYPVLFLTDGVWRFGNCPELRTLMENGECADVLLVTLGYGYLYDGSSEFNRFTHLLEGRNMLLQFVTDNVMPYLGENYHIDYANSSLYGHSNGGVFTHNAVFKSDQYENQPFGRYIIGSPAFWALYNEEYFDLDPDGCEADYSYFDRHEKLDKKVFLCGGSQEDPDYSDSYKGHDTTLEGLAKLNDRLKQKGADVSYKLYESHHYQYIPEMLKEYLKTEYPKK